MSDKHASDLADAVIDLGRLALALGRVDRTACYHPGGTMRESDTDHTVMLTWVAPALADLFYPDRLDAGLVAQFAAVHDMAEVYAGDTPTLRIDAAGREAKAARERQAAGVIYLEFAGRLPWVARILTRYEMQDEPEARFVRAVDKILPKIVHLLDGAAGLREEHMASAELTRVFEQQRADMETYAGEFTWFMDLREELVSRVITLLTTIEAGR